MVSKFLTKHSIMFTLHIMASISVQNDSKWGFASQWIPIINTQARDTYNSTLLQTWVFNRGLRVAVCLRLLHVFPLFHLTNIINTNTFLKKRSCGGKMICLRLQNLDSENQWVVLATATTSFPCPMLRKLGRCVKFVT